MQEFIETMDTEACLPLFQWKLAQIIAAHDHDIEGAELNVMVMLRECRALKSEIPSTPRIVSVWS